MCLEPELVFLFEFPFKVMDLLLKFLVLEIDFVHNELAVNGVHLNYSNIFNIKITHSPSHSFVLASQPFVFIANHPKMLLHSKVFFL